MALIKYGRISMGGKRKFAALRMNYRYATSSLRSAWARRPDESRSNRPIIASQNRRSPQCRLSEAVLRAQLSIRIYIAVLSYYTLLGISGSETHSEKSPKDKGGSVASQSTTKYG